MRREERKQFKPRKKKEREIKYKRIDRQSVKEKKPKKLNELDNNNNKKKKSETYKKMKERTRE